MERMLQSAKSGKNRSGKSYLISHLTGKRLTQRQAIKAKCYECNGMGDQNDCDMEDCPLYPYSLWGLKRRKVAQLNKGEVKQAKGTRRVEVA